MSDLRKLAEAATPGPWRYSSYGIMGFEEAVVSWRYAWEDSEERNRPYIVAADPPTILALLDERDSLATQLDDAREVIVTFRATMEQMRRERDEARAHAEERTAKARVFAKSAAMESDRANEHAATIEATWEALGTIGRGRGVTLPERAAKVVAARDGFCDKGVALTQELAEARATNARLHRRAQGVDARSPDDADLIRRLRAEVRATAKHAGHVAGYVMRLRCALSDAQHARNDDTKACNRAWQADQKRIAELQRERDEARAQLINDQVNMVRLADQRRELSRLNDQVRVSSWKLKAVRRAVITRHRDADALAIEVLRVLNEDGARIIDEKEGGQ